VVTNNVDNDLEVLNINFNPDIYNIRIFLVEKKKTRINKSGYKCVNYEKVSDFDVCIKSTAWSSMKNAVRCKLPGEKIHESQLVIYHEY
jgi:hypothetical protein